MTDKHRELAKQKENLRRQHEKHLSEINEVIKKTKDTLSRSEELQKESSSNLMRDRNKS